MGLFSAFDNYPHPIKRVTGVQSGGYDANSVWVDSVEATVTINAHISSYERDSSETRWSPTVVGPIEEGDMRIYTYDELKKGDEVLVHQDDTSTVIIRYRVIALQRRHAGIMETLGGEARRWEGILREEPR